MKNIRNPATTAGTAAADGGGGGGAAAAATPRVFHDMHAKHIRLLQRAPQINNTVASAAIVCLAGKHNRLMSSSAAAATGCGEGGRCRACRKKRDMGYNLVGVTTTHSGGIGGSGGIAPCRMDA